MRFHGAAAFLLTRGLGPTSHQSALDVSRPFNWMPPQRNVNRMIPALNMVDAELTGKVADAFYEMNNQMKKKDDETLRALAEISASFKKLAEGDFPRLFHTQEPAAVNGDVAPPANGASLPAVALPAVAPISGNAVADPPVNGAHVPEAASARPSFMASLKKNAQFKGSSAPPAATSGSDAPASYMDSLKTKNGASGPSKPAPTSYLDALHQVPDPSPPGHSGSYFDSMARAASMAPANSGPKAPPKQQPKPQAPVTGQMPYSPPSQQQAQAAFSPPPPQQEKPKPQAPPMSYSPPPPQQQTAQATHSQPRPPSMPYAPPQQAAQAKPPAASQRADPPPEFYKPPVAEQKMILEQPPAKVQRMATRAEVLDFGPDHEDMMGAGRAPIVETPKARHVVVPPTEYTEKYGPGFDEHMHSESFRSFPPPHVPQEPLPQSRISIGAKKMSGYIPGIEAPGMSGQAQNIPDPAPKVPISRFAKKVSGLDQMHEQAPRVPEPVPKPPISPFAQIVSGMEGMTERAQQLPTPKPLPPMSVFAKKVGGWDDVSSAPPVSPPPRIEPPMSVFSQKISGMEGMLEQAPHVPQPKPKAPMSVFSQRAAHNMEGMSAPNAPLPMPKPPMSVFSQKIPGITSDMERMQASNGARMVPPAEPQQQQRISIAARKVSGIPNHTAPNPEWYEIQKPSQPVSVFSKKVSGLIPDNGGYADSSQPRPEPPTPRFSKRINSNVPRVVANNGNSMSNESAQHVPKPNPIRRPYVVGVTEAPGFSLDHQEAIEAGSAPRVATHRPTTRNSGWDGPAPGSFEVNPDFQNYHP
ncbi:expressed unknown protein [Seminavis robusta]|uniref:Uncharacterized protein n=1 Tax=Seminavis robusta TaxID=568900 RepID=A0A9N8H0D9_9STRA|nr:expressed unknown protein [Seminavis robusta]|eukprot:Sro19_g013440.1 n/a (810) ;mRNA; r:73464-75893